MRMDGDEWRSWRQTYGELEIPKREMHHPPHGHGAEAKSERLHQIGNEAVQQRLFQINAPIRLHRLEVEGVAVVHDVGNIAINVRQPKH